MFTVAVFEATAESDTVPTLARPICPTSGSSATTASRCAIHHAEAAALDPRGHREAAAEQQQRAPRHPAGSLRSDSEPQREERDSAQSSPPTPRSACPAT